MLRFLVFLNIVITQLAMINDLVVFSHLCLSFFALPVLLSVFIYFTILFNILLSVSFNCEEISKPRAILL